MNLPWVQQIGAVLPWRRAALCCVPTARNTGLMYVSAQKPPAQHFAIYYVLRYEHDFSAGIIAAVNHDGDNDSTGAVTGNILGAINGYDSIEAKWKNHLELMDVLLEMSDDLYHGYRMSEYDPYYDPDWARKYIDAHWKEPKSMNP